MPDRTALDPAVWASLREHFEATSDLPCEERDRRLRELRQTQPHMASLLCELFEAEDSTFLSNPPWAVNAASVPAAMFRPGDIVSERYEVRKFLGAGGSGEVYAVFDGFREQMVALKVIRPTFSAGPSDSSMLRNELNTASLVSHPNVCRVYEIMISRDAGAPDFITMELIEGESLAERLRRGPLTAEEARPIVNQLINGLAAAHECNVIHRDLKPSNILLEQKADGLRAVITDFGLARQLPPGADLSITLSTHLAGTPAYMAPEQLESQRVTRATDLYALGMIMFEMLTGQLPFAGGSPITIAAARLTQQPRNPRDLLPKLDPRWEHAILSCLARDPARRPVSAFDLLTLLELQPPSKWPRRALVTGGAVAAAALLSFGLRPVRRNPEAIRALQQGMVFNQRRTSEGIENALKEFRRAVQLEPRWPEAWVRLADAWGAASNFAFSDPAVALAEARNAARRAVELDDKQARAHGSLGWTLSLDLDLWPQAEAEFRRAVQLDARDPDVRRWYAAWLRKAGRYTEAEAQARAGMNLTNSTDPRQWTEYLAVLWTARRLDRFHKETAAAHRLFPNDSLIESLVARSAEFRGQFDQANETLDYVARLGMNSATVLALKAGVAIARGDIGAARAMAAELETIRRTRPVDGLLLAGIEARTGKPDDAFRILEDTWRLRDNTLLSLATSPWLDNLRSDPRYAEWLSRLHFTPDILSRMEKTGPEAPAR